MVGGRFKEQNLVPRHDNVVIRKVARGESVGGVALPETSQEGIRFIVVAVGPEVKDLNVGDEIVPGGPTLQAEFYPVTGCKDLAVLNEKWCILVVKS